MGFEPESRLAGAVAKQRIRPSHRCPGLEINPGTPRMMTNLAKSKQSRQLSLVSSNHLDHAHTVNR